jgi:large subunit ribosomal protein L6
MSKIGSKPVTIPAGVTVEVSGARVSVKGPKGELLFDLPRGILAEQNGNELSVLRKGDDRLSLALHGTSRALLANMVKGVVEGYEKKLKLVGTGFRAEVAGNVLKLSVGFSHTPEIEIPKELEVSVDKNILITVRGTDKQKVGEFAANVRNVRPPEPYKGKGIMYEGEVIARKVGKAAKAVGGAPGASV